jgi:hypothetical protein
LFVVIKQPEFQLVGCPAFNFNQIILPSPWQPRRSARLMRFGLNFMLLLHNRPYATLGEKVLHLKTLVKLFFLFYIQICRHKTCNGEVVKKLSILCSLFSFLLIAEDEQLTNLKCSPLCQTSQNFFQFQPFCASSARDILMLKTMYTTESPRKEWQGTFSMALEYLQHFGGKIGTCKNLGSVPFWSGTNVMTIGNATGQADVDAYQFGIGDVIVDDQGIGGAITLDTEIMTVGADLLFHMTHQKFYRGFYFTINAPIGAMAVRTDFKEKVAIHDETLDAITNSIWLSYPSKGNRFQSLTQAWQSGSVNNQDSIIIDSSFHKPLTLDKGKVSICRQTVISIADLSLSLGYNLYANENNLISVGLKCTAPTGNVPNGRYILEPTFGRASYWGIGAEFLGHYQIWQHQKQDRGLDFWTKGEILTLRSGRRPNMRTFDLALNGPGSKYLIIQKYFLGVGSNANPSGAVPSYITQAANITTMPVISRFNLEGNLAFLFDFHERNWNLAIGGQVWARSKESLQLDAAHLLRVDAVNINEFAVMGRQVSDDAQSYLLDSNYQILSLHLCQPLARINKSLPRVSSPTVVPPVADLVYPTSLPEGVKDTRLSQNRIPANLYEALDIESARAHSALTTKIFGQFGYDWKEYRLSPNLSIFGGIDFVPTDSNAAINMWSIGVQGSINF